MLLWSFEGAQCLLPPPASVRREPLIKHDLDNLGGHSGGDTPLPIPNREVKPASADGTRGASPRESRTPPSLYPQIGSPLARASDRATIPEGVRSRPQCRRSPSRLVDCLAWSFATAISCFVRGRRTTSMPLSPAATTRTWRGGSRRFRRPYTEADALAFIRGEVAPDEQSSCDDDSSRSRRRHRAQSQLIRVTAARSDTGSRRTHAGRARARAHCVCSHVSPSTSSSFNGSTSSPIPTTSRRNVSPRRSGSGERASFALTCDTRTGGFATR